VLATFVAAAALLVLCGFNRSAFGPVVLLRAEAGDAFVAPVAFLRHPPFLRFVEAGRANLRAIEGSFRMPPGVREILDGATVDLIPWDAAYAAAGTFTWRPRPVFQSYVAYTPWLEELNAQHFRGQRAPRFVVFEPKSSDDHHPFFDEPRMWRELLCRYDLRARADRLFVLERSGQIGCEEPRVTEQDLPLLGEIRLPSEQRNLMVGLDLRPSLLGQLAAAVFKPPIVWVHVRYANATYRMYRLTPAVAASGLALGHLPYALDGLESLFRQTFRPTALPAVSTIQLSTERPWAYRSLMRVRYSRMIRE
jgi:hypothetical protein